MNKLMLTFMQSIIKKVNSKISQIIGIIKHLKHFLPKYTLKTIYDALILPHLNYGLLVWGQNVNQTFKLQKKAIRAITLSKYNSHTEPLFKRLKILKLKDMVTIQELKFHYAFVHNVLPSYFNHVNAFTLFSHRDQHDHFTRYNHRLVVPILKYELSRCSVMKRLPQTVNQTPSVITDKIQTHSQSGYVTYIKNSFISLYYMTCTIPNC